MLSPLKKHIMPEARSSASSAIGSDSESACSSHYSSSAASSLHSVTVSTKAPGLSDELVDFLKSRPNLGEAVSKPKMTRQQQMHQGSHEKQLMLEKKRPGAAIRAVQNPIGNSRRDPQSFNSDETTRTAAFEEAFKAMEKVRKEHQTECKMDDHTQNAKLMQGKAREPCDPRIMAAGHVPPMWWGDGRT
ncbi:unnamed protein product [Amoebophrya sp. A25]|nr:unnamed protein product [Amoebophrya sp. A25]|eukprot:GSA25T00013728001.1